MHKNKKNQTKLTVIFMLFFILITGALSALVSPNLPYQYQVEPVLIGNIEGDSSQLITYFMNNGASLSEATLAVSIIEGGGTTTQAIIIGGKILFWCAKLGKWIWKSQWTKVALTLRLAGCPTKLE